MTSTPADGLPPAIARRFAAMQRQFAAGLPARWHDIEHAPDATTQHSGLHRLAGSAGSFGFDLLGRLAHQAELLVSGDDPAALGQALAEVYKELARCALAIASQSCDTRPGA
ncbi:MAG: Hpt domain-containing protein [Rhodoferax sp.]